MIDYYSWFNYDLSVIMEFTLLSILVWVICYTDDIKAKVKNPFMVGIIVSLISCFQLGLFAVVPLGLFLLLSFVISFWFNKYVKKFSR